MALRPPSGPSLYDAGGIMRGATFNRFLTEFQRAHPTAQVYMINYLKNKSKSKNKPGVPGC